MPGGAVTRCSGLNVVGEVVDNKSVMTYQKIFELKFKEGYSTSELMRRFPEEANKVREIALLQIPTHLLKKIVSEQDLLEKIISLKRKFLGRPR